MIIPKESKTFRVIRTLTCLDNIKCELTSTLIFRAAGIGDLIQAPRLINTRKSNALKARAQVIFFCLVRVACQTVSVLYCPTTEVATFSPRLPVFKSAYRNVHKACFDRRTTQSEFCFETNILCNRRSVQWRTMKFELRKTAFQNKLTLTKSRTTSDFINFYAVLELFEAIQFWTSYIHTSFIC